MRLLHVVAVFRPSTIYGGPTVVAAQQASLLAERGHGVTVATSNVMELRPRKFIEPHTADLSGVRVLYFPGRVLRPPGYRGSPFPFVVSGELTEWLRRCAGGFDAVHVHFAREWIPVQAAQTSLDHGVPTFLQPHGMLARTRGVRGIIDRLWVRRTLESAAAVFALQQHEGDEIKHIAPRARTVVLPNGIDLPVAADRWTVGNLSDPIVVFVARLHPRKRVSAFVRMAHILHSEGVAARYRIVGPDGGDLKEAQRLVREYRMGDYVSFIGSLQGEALAREYINAAAYVLPAVDEPFGMTVLEALSHGVPSVVTDTCFLAPTLKNNRAALVAGPQPEALAESVKAILYAPELAERLSRAGSTLIETHFSLAGTGERLEEYYRMAHARAN